MLKKNRPAIVCGAVKVSFVARRDLAAVPVQSFNNPRGTVLGFTRRRFSVESRWYSGRTDIATYELDELLATKLRALYQRRKSSDLFDLAMGLADGRSDAGRIAAAFQEYMEREGGPVTLLMFEKNLDGKIGDAQFNADISTLLRPGLEWQPSEAARTVTNSYGRLLPQCSRSIRR